MPRFAASLFVIYSLLIALISSSVYAQPRTQPDEMTEGENTQKQVTDLPGDKIFEAKPLKKQIDLKKIFEDETKKFSVDNTRFDPVKIDREKAKQAQKSKWGTKQTVFIVVFAAAVAVLVWLVAKYYKECLETNYPDCTPVVDENCYCERYAEDKDKNRSISIRR